MSQIPNLDLLTQAMLQNAPKTPHEMRRLLDGFSSFMNGRHAQRCSGLAFSSTRSTPFGHASRNAAANGVVL